MRGRGAQLEQIEAIYRRRLRELQRVAAAITGSRETGRDVVQDAFARAVQRRSDFRGEGSLEGWLWRIVVSTARDANRRRGEADAPLENGLAVADESAFLDASGVRELFARLPERQRLAVFLRYYADLDYAAIADALEISVGAVGATLNQARANARRLLTEVER